MFDRIALGARLPVENRGEPSLIRTLPARRNGIRGVKQRSSDRHPKRVGVKSNCKSRTSFRISGPLWNRIPLFGKTADKIIADALNNLEMKIELIENGCELGLVF